MSTIASDAESECDEERSRQVVKMVVRKPAAAAAATTTPVSLLVESLVRQLAGLLESDEARARRLYELLCAKLCEMHLIDDTYRMSELEGARGQYALALLEMARAAGAGTAPTLRAPPAWSRYRREFDELAYIAGGGFGRVFRARHRLDGSQYAVKKVPVRATDAASVAATLDEVKTLASLDHPNIVPYKAAWLELGAPDDTLMLPLIDPSPLTAASDTTSFDVQFEEEGGGNGTGEQECSQQQELQAEQEGEEEEGTCSGVLCRYGWRGPAQWATLYIQMALCQQTLKQWLQGGGAEEGGREAALAVARQLSAGVQYMHGQGVVHHDIKPSNVFLRREADGAWRAQLGDFGLACPLRGAHRSLARGTRLYAAPEQLAGRCHPHSDLYSLGLVLLELAEPCRTDMERVHRLGEARRGRLALRDPLLGPLIRQLLARNPDARPSAEQLLQALQQPPVDDQVRHLQHLLAERDLEIAELRQSLDMARQNELQLRQRLQSAGIDL